MRNWFALVLAVLCVLFGARVAVSGTTQPGVTANGTVLGYWMPTLVTMNQQGPASCSNSGLPYPFDFPTPNTSAVTYEFFWPFNAPPPGCSGLGCLAGWPTIQLYANGVSQGAPYQTGFDMARGVVWATWVGVPASMPLAMKVGHQYGPAPTFNAAAGHVSRLIATDMCD